MVNPSFSELEDSFVRYLNKDAEAASKVLAEMKSKYKDHPKTLYNQALHCAKKCAYIDSLFHFKTYAELTGNWNNVAHHCFLLSLEINSAEEVQFYFSIMLNNSSMEVISTSLNKLLKYCLKTNNKALWDQSYLTFKQSKHKDHLAVFEFSALGYAFDADTNQDSFAQEVTANSSQIFAKELGVPSINKIACLNTKHIRDVIRKNYAPSIASLIIADVAKNYFLRKNQESALSNVSKMVSTGNNENYPNFVLVLNSLPYGLNSSHALLVSNIIKSMLISNFRVTVACLNQPFGNGFIRKNSFLELRSSSLDIPINSNRISLEADAAYRCYEKLAGVKRHEYTIWVQNNSETDALGDLWMRSQDFISRHIISKQDTVMVYGCHGYGCSFANLGMLNNIGTSVLFTAAAVTEKRNCAHIYNKIITTCPKSFVNDKQVFLRPPLSLNNSACVISPLTVAEQSFVREAEKLSASSMNIILIGLNLAERVDDDTIRLLAKLKNMHDCNILIIGESKASMNRICLTNKCHIDENWIFLERANNLQSLLIKLSKDGKSKICLLNPRHSGGGGGILMAVKAKIPCIVFAGNDSSPYLSSFSLVENKNEAYNLVYLYISDENLRQDHARINLNLLKSNETNALAELSRICTS